MGCINLADYRSNNQGEIVNVVIDGNQYVPVGSERITLNGVVYARILDLTVLAPAWPPYLNRIVDNDTDTWKPMAAEGEWSMTGPGGGGYSRDYIESHYGIRREYHA